MDFAPYRETMREADAARRDLFDALDKAPPGMRVALNDIGLPVTTTENDWSFASPSRIAWAQGDYVLASFPTLPNQDGFTVVLLARSGPSYCVIGGWEETFGGNGETVTGFAEQPVFDGENARVHFFLVQGLARFHGGDNPEMETCYLFYTDGRALYRTPLPDELEREYCGDLGASFGASWPAQAVRSTRATWSRRDGRITGLELRGAAGNKRFIWDGMTHAFTPAR